MGLHPLISIIIPVYNISDYIDECLRSVLNQTFTDYEVIVIDDGSADGSGIICDRFTSDPRVHVYHTENRGLSAARNLALSCADGDYVLFLDGDDWIDADTIGTLLSAAMRIDADIAAAGIIEEKSGTVKRCSLGSSQMYSGSKIMKIYAEGNLRDVVWNKLYRRDILRPGCFQEGMYYEDIGFTWKLIKTTAQRGGRIAVLSGCPFHHRIREGSISHSRSCRVIMDCWSAYMDKYNSLPDYQNRLLPGCMTAIGKMWMNYGGFTESEKEKCRKILKEMHSFSKANRTRILNGDYEDYVKKACIL